MIKAERLILIEDDIASWINAALGKQEESLFNRLSEKCVYIYGMSKSLCPGVRVAFLAYSEDLKTKIENGIFNLNVKNSSLDAEIITRILSSKDAVRLIKEKYNSCKKANALYEQIFPREKREDVVFSRCLEAESVWRS